MRQIKYFVLLLIAFIGAFSCKTKTGQQQETVQAVPVKIVQVQEFKYNEVIKSSGRVSSEEELKLSFKNGGVISKIYANEGQQVSKGSILAKLNLGEIEAQVKQTRIGLEKAKRDFKRVENLYNDSVATLEQYQNARSMLEISQSNVEIAEFNLNYSEIKAPSNGTVLMKLAEENEIVGQGYPVLLFGSNEANWIVKTNVTDKHVIKLSIGNLAHVFLDAYPDTFFKAKVIEIGSFADPYTGTFEVKLELEKTSFKLVSGLIAKIEITTNIELGGIKIPYKSVIEADENSGFIYQVVNNKPVKKKVIIQKIADDHIVISTGMKPGDTLITEGASYIKNGEEIEIVNLKN